MNLLLFPQLTTSAPKRFGTRTKVHPRQMVLFPSKDYKRYGLVVKKQTPKWADKKAIAEVYKHAKQLRKETGLPYEVDHIVPLNGGSVCGLHVVWNLRVVLKKVNNAKNARHWPGMPGETGVLI